MQEVFDYFDDHIGYCRYEDCQCKDYNDGPFEHCKECNHEMRYHMEKDNYIELMKKLNLALNVKEYVVHADNKRFK